MRLLLAALFVAFPLAASAEAASATAGRGTDWIAIGMFVAIVVATLIITYRSAGSTKSKADFYTAGHSITPLQNGLAIAGDFLSAAAFLGISALVYANGFDGFLYALGFLTGWPIVLFLMSERLRNLDSYTFANAAAFRLDRTPIRLVAAIGSLVVVLFYLVAQMIGAGKVIELLFGVNYLIAVTSVGVLMILYVTVGGAMMRRSDLLADPRYATARLRRENLASLLAEVRAWLATFDTFEQLQVQVSEAGLAVGRIQTVSEFAKSDWVREWNAVVEVDDRGGGSVRMPGNPWIFSQSELPCPGAPAYQGEHNGEILKELQVSEDKIRDLEERSITLSRR
jgi:hypothetical protein